MARIVADRGVQVYQVPRTVDQRGGAVRYREFDLDCSCTLRVDDRYLFNVGRADMMTRIAQVAEAHICEIEVFMVHTEQAQRLRAAYTRAQQEHQVRRPIASPGANAPERTGPPLRYMGLDVSIQSDETWLTTFGSRARDAERWQREIIGSFRVDQPRRRTPAEVERSMRENPAPRQAPEQQVQAAARQAEALRGVGATQVIVDEVARFDHARPVGFQPVPEKKPDPDVRPDRFMLIELD